LSDQYFKSYSDFKVFKALNSKTVGTVGNAIISQTMAANELSLVSFESATKVVQV